MSRKQKMILIICIIAGIIVIAGGIGLYFVLSPGSSGSGSATAYVDSVAMITGLGNGNGTQNRYSGVVEAQESMDVTKDDQKTIREIFVSVGDEVEIGTPLFEYDTDKTALELEQARIDLESLINEITNYNNQIAELQKEKAKAPASEQLNYTTQIQTAQLNAKRSEYNKKSKEAEIEKLEKDMTNATVTSQMRGVIKALNTSGEYDYNTGNPKPFMTIMAVGDYRIKGKVNEQNVWSLMEGQQVLIRSRVDANVTWTGTITRIDTTSTYTDENNNSGVYYYGGSSGDSGQNSTNYAFYVTPDISGELMLGQHVFIELNGGQEEEKENLWLSSMYMIFDGDDAYVWAANSKNRLEKRKLELGDYNSDMDEYEILGGLTADDYIAFPGNLLEEGMNCAVNDGTHSNSSMDGYEDMNGMEGDMGYDMNGMEDGMVGMEDGMNGMNGMEDGMIGMEDGMVGMEDGMIGMEDGMGSMDAGMGAEDGTLPESEAVQ